jgi:regulator of RNase E activity RraA
VKGLGFHFFSGSVVVSHSYAHITEFGEPIEIDGLKIHSGDLMHGDVNGVHTIPLSVAPELPAEAATILAEERDLIDFCRSPQFSLEELSKRLQETVSRCDLPWRAR